MSIFEEYGAFNFSSGYMTFIQRRINVDATSCARWVVSRAQKQKPLTHSVRVEQVVRRYRVAYVPGASI